MLMSNTIVNALHVLFHLDFICPMKQVLVLHPFHKWEYMNIEVSRQLIRIQMQGSEPNILHF